jgi:MFS family permease
VTAPAIPRVAAATRATYIAFLASGFAFANWAARIPQVRDDLSLDASGLGLVLLAIAVGSVVALPAAGAIVHRLGSRRTVASMSALAATGMTVAAVGLLFGVVPVVIGLVLLGFGYGAWDVAMNVQGTVVERLVGRAIMPRFHAGFSVGTVAGALVGAGMVALHVAVPIHLLVVAVVIGLVVPLSVRRFLPQGEAATGRTTEDPADAGSGTLRHWREARTLLIGLCALGFTFAEGTGNDWISVALIDGYSAPPVVGTLGFAAFLAAMTAARWFGPGSLDRYGRVVVVRVLAGVGVVGLLLFVFGGGLALAFLGALLWGAGAAMGFPVGMSAAADQPVAAAGRVSVVASIAYCAFLAGPPFIGFLGQHVTVLRALSAVTIVLAVAILLAGALRPLRGGAPPERSRSGNP